MERAAGMMLKSSVLRVKVSKLRMPRSQSMIWALPSASMYSAQLSHSSSVEYMPRLSSMGLPDFPASRRREKFCILRAPICSMSAYSPTQLTSRVSITSVTMGRPVSRLALSSILRPL
jgi:hypothetical protein